VIALVILARFFHLITRSADFSLEVNSNNNCHTLKSSRFLDDFLKSCKLRFSTGEHIYPENKHSKTKQKQLCNTNYRFSSYYRPKAKCFETLLLIWRNIILWAFARLCYIFSWAVMNGNFV